MLDRETDARLIGYGAMLCKGLVGVIALVAALREVGENLAGRTGGGVS